MIYYVRWWTPKSKDPRYKAKHFNQSRWHVVGVDGLGGFSRTLCGRDVYADEIVGYAAVSVDQTCSRPYPLLRKADGPLCERCLQVQGNVIVDVLMRSLRRVNGYPVEGGHRRHGGEPRADGVPLLWRGQQFVGDGEDEGSKGGADGVAGVQPLLGEDRPDDDEEEDLRCEAT